MIKEFLFSWINKPQYLLTISESIIAIIEILVVIVLIYLVASFIEKIIRKTKKNK